MTHEQGRAVPVITVDGPSGSGKGTLALRLARTLDFHLLDSGSLYRLTGLAAQRAGIALHEEAQLAECARSMDIAFEAPAQDSGTEILGAPAELVIRLDGQDVTTQLRTEQSGDAASQVAALPQVRSALLDVQRAFRRPPGLVADGRDMGTVVFKDALLKFFLTASAQVRAERRYKQLKEKGLDVNLRALAEAIAARDERDRARTHSPLLPADDAVVIDSSAANADQVFVRVVRELRAKGLSAGA